MSPNVVDGLDPAVEVLPDQAAPGVDSNLGAPAGGEALVSVVSEGVGLVLAPPLDDSALRAVRQYVHSQLSPRSRENAIDALRRIARVVSGDPSATAESFQWPKLTLETARLIRRVLYDRTLPGAVSPISPGTANLTLSHLRGIVRTMYEMRLITVEQLVIAQPMMVKNLQGTRTERGQSLSTDAERRLRRTARRIVGYRGTMLETAIVIAIGAGLRREEVAGITMNGLSEPGLLSVVGKGNKERRVAIDDRMQEAIERWMTKRNELKPIHHNLFCSPERPEQKLSPWSFWSLVRTAAHAAFGDGACKKDCPCLRIVTGPHDFRRTFVTRLLSAGFDLREVQVLAGHASPETTARYDKRATSELLDKRRRMKMIAILEEEAAEIRDPESLLALIPEEPKKKRRR